MAATQTPEVRLAEFVASLSLATDLGLGQPQEHVLRQTVIATRLAAAAGMAPADAAPASAVNAKPDMKEMKRTVMMNLLDGT